MDTGETNFPPVIVGIDGSQTSLTALRWALAVADPDQQVIAVHCWERTSAELRPSWDAEAIATDLDEVRAWCANELDHANLEVASLDADPRSELGRQVEVHGAGLVVVGDRGQGGVLGLGLGSVATHLLHGSDVAVAVVREHHVGSPGGPVVVGVDGSAANRAALEWAVRFAERRGLPLIGVNAAESCIDSGTGPVVEEWAWPTSDAVRKEIAQLEPSTGPVDLRFNVGHPVQVLDQVSSREGATATVVGTRGHGGFGGLRLGRIPQQLAHVASRPVIVVPHT